MWGYTIYCVRTYIVGPGIVYLLVLEFYFDSEMGIPIYLLSPIYIDEWW